MTSSAPYYVVELNTDAISSVDQSDAWRNLAIAGAAQGLRTWIAYWVAECFLWIVWPWLTTPSYEYGETHPWFPPLALCLYMIAGAGLGAALAILFGRLMSGRAERAVPLVGPLSFVLPCGILALWTGQRAQLIIAFLLLAILVTSFRRTAWLETVRLCVNFWSAPLGLLAYPFVLGELYKRAPAIGHFIAALAVISVFSVSYIASRLLKKTGPRNETRAPSRHRSLAAWASVVAIALAMGFTLRQRPILADPPGNPAAASEKALPNVILISLDTVRADHLSVYGYSRDTSPSLRKFAGDATVFTHAIAASNMTLSSHASMFTGLYPSQHGAHWALGSSQAGVYIYDALGLRLPENSQTLARILSARGYRTIGVAANTAYLQHAFRMDQGFQYYSQPYRVHFLQTREDFYLRSVLCRAIARCYPRSMADPDSVRAADVNRQVFQLLQRDKANGKPMFLFLNYMDAHQPYFPPAPYDSRYPGKDPTLRALQYWKMEFGALAGSRPYSVQDRQRDESQYDGGIAYLDANLGDLFQNLKDLGLYDNSIIIVTSDHGNSFGEKRLVGHGTSVYQEQVLVPLLVKYPGPPQAAVRDDLVSHVDLLPTVLDLLGEKIPPSLPGHSLRAVAAPPKPVLSESFPCDMIVSLSPRFRRIERAAFSGSFKLIVATNGKREFYNLAADPHEEQNLYALNPVPASRMEGDLRHWVSALPPDHYRPATLDKSAVNRLKSLGYVQ